MAVLQKPIGLNKSCFLLIVIAGIERFAYKGVASNLVTYLTDMFKMSNSAAAKTVNNWCGFTSMLPLLVAWIADSCWDRNSTILVSSFLYVTGLVALTSTALARAWYPDKNTVISSTFLFSSLCLISLGQGGYNPSLQAFGADQLGDEEELPCTKEDGAQGNKRSLFFQWWYFGVCAGSLLGVTVMSYIQDTVGWVLGFAIPTIAMVLSIILFCGGRSIFVYREDGTIEKKHFQDMVRAIKGTVSKFINCGVSLSRDKIEDAEIELEEKPLCPENLGDAKVVVEDGTAAGFNLPENVRVVLRLVPIWTLLLMFAVIFQQPATFFTKQGMTMKRSIGSDFKIPPATLQSAITVSIILLMPLYDKVMIPVTRLFTGNEKGITVTQRMGIGMVLSIVAMVIAALIETKRHKMSKNIEVLEPQLLTVPLSIFWLLPQYILLGISDIFTVVGMQEFFYSEVPTNMKTMGIALYTSVFGVGSFLSAFLISATEILTSSGGGQSWFIDDMREARLDKYYWLLVILSSISMVLYVILCRCYKSRSDALTTNCK